MMIEPRTPCALGYRRVKRRGLTLLELLGCMGATTGGVVLGSMYLGVDVVATTAALLERTGIVVAPAAAAPIVATSPAARTPPAADASPAEFGVEKPAEATAPAAPAPLRDVTTLSEVLALTDDQRRALTLAYWKALDECMNAETAHRSEGMGSDGNWELYNYLTCRHEGHQTAAETIAQLNRRGVDPHVAAYGEKALAWHEEGAQLYAQAKVLLTDAPTAQLSGPLAESWQSAAKQHQMEQRVLVEKHRAVLSYLEHQER